MVWFFIAPSNWVFWLAVNMRDFEKLPIREHSVEWNMRIGVIISDEPRINDEIRVSQVRLIGPNGEQVGVIATSVALNLAKEANLDLVEVAPNAKPPVAKLIDYGKYKYNEKIKAREARRNQSTAEIKEIRFRLKIDDHDFEVKKGHVVRFLNGGDKVKVTIMLRGREQSRPIGGVELLQRLASEVEEYGTVEFAPKQEGRNIIMTLAPKGKKVHTQSEQRRRGDQSRCRASGPSGCTSGGQAGSPSSGGGRSQGCSGIRQTEDFRNEVTNKEGSNAEDEN